MTQSRFNPPYPPARPLVAVEVLIDVTQRIQETYRAFVSPDDPMVKLMASTSDPISIFSDSRFKMVESEYINTLHADVVSVKTESIELEAPHGAD